MTESSYGKPQEREARPLWLDCEQRVVQGEATLGRGKAAEKPEQSLDNAKAGTRKA